MGMLMGAAGGPLLLAAAAAAAAAAVAVAAAAGRGSKPFPSMVFMENNTWDGPKREGLNYTVEQEHARQILIASNYQLVRGSRRRDCHSADTSPLHRYWNTC